jgi:hypothetical protein
VVMGARDDSLSQFAYELLRRFALTNDEVRLPPADFKSNQNLRFRG